MRFWPGLGGLLRYGRWSFLIISLLFALALNGFMVLNFYWTELLSGGGRWTVFFAFVISWAVLGAVSSGITRRIEAVAKSDEKPKHFQEAIIHYLKGNWFETECTLNAILRRNPRDIESMLMLATLYRHTARYAESLDMLAKVELFEESAYWFIEIETEKFRVREILKKEENNEPEEESDTERDA